HHAARLGGGDFAAGRRHRRNEHHAGQCYRAHARNRHPHGDRGAHAQHPAAVPHRGDGRLRRRRAARRRDRFGRGEHHSGVRYAGEVFHRAGAVGFRLRLHRRAGVRLHAGAQGGAARSGTGVVGRVVERLMKPALIVLLASITLSGCALTSERPPMRLDMPADYRAEAPVATVALTQDWWRSFESSELAGLIDLALRDSPDLGMAVERVRQAEAQVRIAGSSLFPQLDLSASTNRRRTDPDRGSAVTTESTSATLSASYEIDAWGRNASGRRAAEALLDLSRFDEESPRLTTVAGAANAYFQVLSLRGRLEVARENLAIAERVLDIVQIRARNGVVSQLDVARQNSAVLSQRAAIPALALQERQTLAALAILVGQPPQHFDVKGADVGDVAVPVVAPGLPAELLVRRPDLAAAEAQLVAANANLAAARAALLPSLQLTTSAGLANN